MANRSLIASLTALLLALSAVPMAANGQDSGGWRSNWNGNSFNGPPPPPAPPTNDLAMAMRNASLARSGLQAATENLAAVKARVRVDFENSEQFTAARQELADARQAYDDARVPVVSKVQRDANYRGLIEQRTQVDIELRSATSRSSRQELAARKLSFSAQAELILSGALLRSGDVQNARARVERAQQAVTDQRARFVAEFSSRPEILAAEKSLENARANRDAADAYLNGALLTRSDAMTIAAASAAPAYNNNYNPYWGGYPYGGFGFPFFGGGGIFIGHGGHHR